VSLSCDDIVCDGDIDAVACGLGVAAGLLVVVVVVVVFVTLVLTLVLFVFAFLLQLAKSKQADSKSAIFANFMSGLLLKYEISFSFTVEDRRKREAHGGRDTAWFMRGPIPYVCVRTFETIR
jgi:hypothetical protein